jgi:farnesol dehydrogenase
MLGKWKIMPGDGSSTGSYVYIDDIVQGHILAMQNGRSGERYALGGVNASYTEFFDALAKLTGKKIALIKLPVWAMVLAGNVLQFFSAITGKPPLLTPPWIRKYNYNWAIDCTKAQKELGYSFIGLEAGLQKTIEWLQQRRKL